MSDFFEIFLSLGSFFLPEIKKKIKKKKKNARPTDPTWQVRPVFFFFSGLMCLFIKNTEAQTGIHIWY